MYLRSHTLMLMLMLMLMFIHGAVKDELHIHTTKLKTVVVLRICFF
jgi:hypothetical protein